MSASGKSIAGVTLINTAIQSGSSTFRNRRQAAYNADKETASGQLKVLPLLFVHILLCAVYNTPIYLI